MSDPYVFHFELVRDGKVVDRIATRAMEPAEMRRLVAQHGRRGVGRMIENERLAWQRLVLQVEGPGHAVQVRRERGYLRSRWPGAALRPSAPPAALVAVPGQEVTQ